MGLSYAQDSASVLFIGNSYTYVNDLPNLIYELADSQGDYFHSVSQTPGGMTFQGHATNPATYAAMAGTDWDFVVLQAQSQEPSFSDSQVNTGTLPFAMQLGDSIRANHFCSDILMFMTWGRENGDPQWGPISTFDGMNGRLRLAYLRMADSLDASVSAVGSAWKYVRENHPTIGLYAGDGSHPSLEGSYLAACVFYASMYRKTPVGASFISTLTPIVAEQLQTAAALTVMDSLTFFNLHASTDHTQADFSYVVNAGVVSFTNNSVRAQTYSWNFDDGQTSTDVNPTNTYTTSGTYTVSLISESECDTDTIEYDIVISGVSITENEDLGLTYAQISDGVFEILGSNEIDFITVMDASGRFISQTANTLVDLSQEPKGMYLITLQLGDKLQRIRVIR